jgi:hypothetical protein
MKMNHSEYTISELVQMLQKKEIIINSSYQRSAGLWPLYAQTYFIDTILEGFPFPKLYFYQSFDRSSRKPIKEVVDGQQRLKTIEEFANNKLVLTSASKKYDNNRFEDLSEEKQEEFLMYSVPTDVILGAERPVLLEMFRRFNAYTAPLNSAEKRHSEFQGEFKWFINQLADRFSPILETFSILTPKQMVRMADAEMIAEFAIVLDSGIVHKSSASLRDVYREYDAKFPHHDYWTEIISSFFDYVVDVFSALKGTFIMKPYVFHSLFTAMAHLKYGIPRGEEQLGVKPIKKFCINYESAIDKLRELAEAHELQDLKGPYADYVESCLQTTTKATQRKIRTRSIIEALLSK